MADIKGIDCSASQLANWTCSLKTYELLGIRWSSDANTTSFVQDLVDWLTFFIWTVVLVALLFSGLMLIFSAWDEKLAEKWKLWIKYSLIWLVLVIWSYAIVKFIKFFMKW